MTKQSQQGKQGAEVNEEDRWPWTGAYTARFSRRATSPEMFAREPCTHTHGHRETHETRTNVGLPDLDPPSTPPSASQDTCIKRHAQVGRR